MSSSLPLLFDRSLVRDIRRIAVVLENGPADGLSVLRIATEAAIDMGRAQRVLNGWREYFTPVPQAAGQRWRLNPASRLGADAEAVTRDVRRRRSLWRTGANFAALALMILAFLATIYFLDLGM